MDIKQLQYFVTSVDLGSFHAAAEVLITTQPNVSKVIKALEEEMGMVLLVRNRSGVTLTREGEQVYRYALSTLKNFEMLNSLKGEREEGLTVCCTPSNNLSTLLAEFYGLKAYRKPHLDLREGDFEDIVVWVHRRSAELGFTYISRRNQPVFEERLRTKGLEFHELAKTSLFVLQRKESAVRQAVRFRKGPGGCKADSEKRGHSLSVEAFRCFEWGGVKQIRQTGDRLYKQRSFLIQLLKHTDYCSVDSSFLKR